jgi:iron complex outermembrane recepter protein
MRSTSRPDSRIALLLASAALVSSTARAAEPVARHRHAAAAKPPSEENIEVRRAHPSFRFGAAQHQAATVTEYSGADLVRLGVTKATDLQKIAPNVSIMSMNGTQTTVYYIRGIGMSDFTQNAMPSVMTYIDGVPYPVSSMSAGMLFDIATVGVVAGPVGTEHGLADSAGEVNIRTNDPTPDWHGGVSQDIASYARSRTTLYVSGPIAPTLSFRIAGQTEHGGGWQYSPANATHLGNADMGALRAKLRWTPDARTTVQFSAHWLQDDSQTVAVKPVLNSLPSKPYPSLPYQEANWSLKPAFARLIGRPASLYPSEHDTNWGADLNVAHDFSFATLQSISAYETERIAEYTDQDGTKWATGDTYRSIWANSFTQELRLHSRDDSAALQWDLGATYNRIRMNTNFFGDSTDYLPLRGYMLQTHYHQDGQTFAQFAHLSYRLPGRVSLFGGINHEANDQQLLGLNTKHIGINSLSFADEGANANQFSGVLGAQWQATARTMLYFKVSKGFKPGGFTANNTVVQSQLTPYKPETLLSYEAGIKSDVIANRLRLNAAAFYYDYHDQQYLGTYVVPSFGPLGRYTNIPKSEIWGVEFSADIHPFKGFYIHQNLGYQRGKFQDFQSSNTAAVYAHFQQTGIWAPFYTSYNGYDLGQPKLTLNGSADYTLQPPGPLSVETGLDWSYRGAQALTPGGTGVYMLPSYFLLGAHMTVRPTHGHWAATLYATNLLNREYYTTGGSYTVTEFWLPGPPRFIGGRVSIDY